MKRSLAVKNRMFSTSHRKAEHLDIVVKEDVDFKVSACFEDVHLIHNAMPDMSLDDVSTESVILGKKLSAPIIIAAMTGGHPIAYQVNAQLAEIAEKLKVGFSLGSQRAALENCSLEYTYRVAREKAPTTLILGNIGAPQLLQNPIERAKKAIAMIQADALVVHLNPLQEALQLEGEASYAKVLDNLSLLAKELDKPVIVKETGCGLSKEVAEKLARIGVAGIDVSGSGGTSWAAVEYYRAVKAGDFERAEVCKSFWNWGIPTAISICEVRKGVGNDLLVIATGGVRNGIQVAKALALGANAVGIAAPLLKTLVNEGIKQVERYLKRLIFELKIAMFLVGACTVDVLRDKPVILTGLVGDWVRARGLKRKNLLTPE